ncbi:response regulator transcription factor [Pseudorhodoferax soli]|uniref:DNA-binding NarL/FixJ family response regulator n=1 Tax=Pseudorhodoferax soli TaxID=545864 RepID=A0A368XUV4_9BURK|nr:response regulator transcription factor [Pseudorhodoferax soli]RCW70317.1 DNA-binding NarL/FixJ family response regulator [Pseudorhodoferax soli]
MVQIADSFLDHGRVPVAVYHRDPLLCLGILASLQDVPRLDARAIDSFDAMARWRDTAPGGAVVVCDYETGAALAEGMGRYQGAPCVMVVTQRDREADVQSALARGVQGYLLVGCRLDEVVEGVFALSRGQRFLSASAAQRVADRICYEALTPREDEVLRFVAVGWSNKMVANRLGVTEGTVKSHVKAILGKLAVRTRTEAASVAMRRGLVMPDAGAATASPLALRSGPLRYEMSLAA